jgi:hypothetical protein
MLSSGVVRKKKALTCDEHRELAAHVKDARKLLAEIDLRVSNGLGHTSKAARIAHQIKERFDLGLKDELDEAVKRDCPEMDVKERLALYYGSTSDNKVVLHRSRK